MSVSIELDLRESLSCRACSVILRHLIKFIAYNNQQIPYTYEGFQRLVALKRKRLNVERDEEAASMAVPQSFQQIRANTFYEKIEHIYNGFEMTFKCIEEELIAGNVLKEVVIILGATLFSPKHMYRILIPKLISKDDCDGKIRSNLFSIYRSIVVNGHKLSSRCSGLTNMFILINGACKLSVDSGWFIPKFDFTLPMTVPQTTISFADIGSNSVVGSEDVSANVCSVYNSSLYTDLQSLQEPLTELVPTITKWFMAKQTLSGFQDLKIDGISAFNVLSGIGSW